MGCTEVLLVLQVQKICLESLTKLINESRADNGASQCEQRDMSIETSFEADTQFAETGKPCVGAFDYPAMSSEFFATLDTAAGDTCRDTSLLQRFTAMRIVVTLVSMYLVWALPRPPGHTWHGWYCIKHRLKHFRVVPVGSGDDQRQRDALSVYCDMTLAAELSPVGWIWPGLFAPRGLATLAPSMLTRLQSIASYPRSRASSARCRRCHTPAFCQSRRRRQHVMPLPKPICCGKSSHGMPVCSTNRIPFNVARSSTRGRPPFGERARSGSSGSSVSHNSSLIRCLVIPLQTCTPRFRMTGFVSDS